MTDFVLLLSRGHGHSGGLAAGRVLVESNIYSAFSMLVHLDFFVPLFLYTFCLLLERFCFILFLRWHHQRSSSELSALAPYVLNPSTKPSCLLRIYLVCRRSA